MTEALVIDDPDGLLAREAALRAGGATPRMRDAAAALGVPEAALLEARRATGTARRLRRPQVAEGFGAVLARLPEAGEVMALTRNEACVHETHGRFTPPAFEGAMGQVVGEIDLRLFLRPWRFGYAARRGHPLRPAPQPAVLRRRRHRDLQGLRHRRHRCRRLRPHRRRGRGARRSARPLRAGAAARGGTAGRGHRRAGLLAAWEGLKHTHEFFVLLRRFGVTRAQAMRLGAPTLARPAGAAAARELLTRAAAASCRSWSSSATPAACRSMPARCTGSR